VRLKGAKVLFLVAFVSLFFACTRTPEPGTSERGTPNPGTSEPRNPEPARIISLVPAVTEMLFAIGAGDRVIGVSTFDAYPPEVTTRQKVGALIDPDFERIVGLRPDLVVVYGSQTEFIARLARASVPMFQYEHAGLADVTVTIRALGERVGRKARADAVAGAIERELDAIRQSVSDKPHPKTALVFGREPGALRNIYASGGIGFMHDMLEAAGGTDVFSDVKRQSLQATTEFLLARAPDVILELYPSEGWTPERRAREIAVWNGLPSLPAVRMKRVHILTEDRLLIPGPRVAECVRALSAAIYARGPG
jgi:cobalamin transport system substrate-binding protein